MSFTFCTSQAIIDKAGSAASEAITTNATALAIFYDNAEAVVSTVSRFDYVTVSGSLQTNIKPILADAISDLAAIHVVAWDMVGYPSRIVAEDMINVLRDGALRNLSLLRDQKGVKFLKDGA